MVWPLGKKLSIIHKKNIRNGVKRFLILYPSGIKPPQEKKPKYTFPKGHKINLVILIVL